MLYFGSQNLLLITETPHSLPPAPHPLNYLLLFKSLMAHIFPENFSFYCPLLQFLFAHVYIDLYTTSSSVANSLALPFQDFWENACPELQNILTFFIQMPILFPVEVEDLGKGYSIISHLFWFTLIVLARFSVLIVLTMLQMTGMLLRLQRAVQYHPRSSYIFFLLYITIGIPASIKMTFILPMIASSPFITSPLT